MIRLVESPADAARFQAALAGRTDPVAVETAVRFAAFHRLPGSGWRFYTGGEGEEPFALAVRGASALLTGSAEGEETALLLNFLQARRLKTARPDPLPGWRRDAAFHVFYAPAEGPVARPLPEGPVARPLPEGFVLNEAPSLLGVTEFLWGGESMAAPHDRRSTDTFYSEICTMRNRGLAQIWTLEEKGVTAATAGAYAITENAALLSAVETAPAFRGKGCAGALVCALARELCGQGKAVCLVARPGVEGFYEKLGFEQRGLTYGHTAPEND